MVDVIACFLTCGYTEAGAMQFFLKKINDRYEYRQCLPNKTIKKKGMPKKIDDKMSGRTGEALLEKVYELIEKHRDEYSQCRAILVEDDLDGRFAGYSQKEVGEYNRRNCLFLCCMLHRRRRAGLLPTGRTDINICIVIEVS